MLRLSVFRSLRKRLLSYKPSNPSAPKADSTKPSETENMEESKEASPEQKPSKIPVDPHNDIHYIQDGFLENQNDGTTLHGHLFNDLYAEARDFSAKLDQEIPRLSEYRKEWIPPKSTAICIESNDYLTEPEHPINSTVAMHVKVNEMSNLSDKERKKMILLAETDYDAEKQTITINSERFPHPAQNKQFLLYLLRRIVRESGRGDMFEDVPVDIFSKKLEKKQLKFPEHWLKKTEESV